MQHLLNTYFFEQNFLTHNFSDLIFFAYVVLDPNCFGLKIKMQVTVKGEAKFQTNEKLVIAVLTVSAWTGPQLSPACSILLWCLQCGKQRKA